MPVEGEGPAPYCCCDLWRSNPQLLADEGVPPGYCGICACGTPGHVRHYPGPVPFTGAWCDDCYGRLPGTPRPSQLVSVVLSLIVAVVSLIVLL